MKEVAYVYLALIISFILTYFTRLVIPQIESDYILSFYSVGFSILFSFGTVLLLRNEIKFVLYIIKLIGHSDKNAIEFVANINTGSYARITFTHKKSDETLSVAGVIHSYDSVKEPKFITLKRYVPVNKANIDEDSISYEEFKFLKDENFKYLVIPLNNVLFIEIVNEKKKKP